MEEKKKKLDGLFIGIIIFVACFIVGFVAWSKSTSRVDTNTAVEEKKNPYTVSNQYDGTYYFKLESTYYFWAFGIITFNNGNCEAKYVIPSKITTYSDEYKFKGYCGFDENNNFIFNLNNNQYLYKCEKYDGGLNCTLNAQYDLTGNTEKNLQLSLLDSSIDINSFYYNYVQNKRAEWKLNVEQKEAETKAKLEAEEKAKKEAEEKAKIEEEQNFKASCEAYTFEQMARNPDNFKGTNVKLTGEVIQALYGTNSVDLRVNITKKGSYSTYYTDTIYVTYNTKKGEDKILEDDIITIYGTSLGDYTYKSTIGSTVNLPLISAKYIEINK